MGRSSADAEVWPNVWLGSARQHVTIRPAKLRQTFSVICGFAYAVLALTSQYTYY